MEGRRPTEARIQLDAVRENFAELRRRAGGLEVFAVVKADAYGHGAGPVAAALVAAGCTRFAVVSVAEAAALRESGRGEEILVLGGVHDADEAGAAAALDLVPVVHLGAHVEWLARAAARRGRPLPVHVEVDTGMSRMGARPELAPDLLAAVAAAPGLRLAGTYTHLARADEADLAPTRRQLALFREVLEAARKRDVDPGLVHFGNSAAVAGARELAGDAPAAGAVRLGLGIYGAQPAPSRPLALHPVMRLVTRVAHLRDIRPGDSVGYGGEFTASAPTRIATLPVGFADGLPRAAAGRARVWLAGAARPVVGRISMDYVTVDVGDAAVALGDEAVIFGPELPVDELAAAAGTIAYELLVGVGARVPRVYRDGPNAV